MEPAQLKDKGKCMKKIFVGNLDTASTETAIRSLFEPHGTVDGVKVITDRDTGRPRGFAFVEMADSAEADRAISALNGRRALVDLVIRSGVRAAVVGRASVASLAGERRN